MNIVICGGGTAGWLAAYIIENSQPNIHKITVVESSEIGIIGAGEGSTGALYDVVSGSMFNRNDSIEDFIQKTDATKKYGIMHSNWSKNKNESYFAPLDGSLTTNKSPDLMFNYVVSKYGNNKAHLSSNMGQAYSKNILPDRSLGCGFHFDGVKVGQYFKDKLRENKNINCIDSKIKDVSIATNGSIEKVILEDGLEVYGDFFFDCTGFPRVLMKKLNVGWDSFSKNLPMNKAMPFIIDYESKLGTKIEPLTTATAMSSGWMWDIPLQTRIGSGYVYSSDFISDDDAKKEVETFLGRKIQPIKYINFDSGVSNELWKKNCIALGLAGAFSEPLEATSIHSTIHQILSFCFDYLFDTVEDTATETHIKLYNRKFKKLYEDFKNFLVLHYQGGRDDSEFWKYIKTGETRTDFVEDILEVSKKRVPSNNSYDSYLGANPQLWNWILSGLNLINPEDAGKTLKFFNLYDSTESEYKNFSNYYYSLENSLFSFEIFPPKK